MKQIRHFEDALQKMHEEGITRNKLQKNHHMTKYGAQKFLRTLPTQIEEEETAGGIANAKKHYLSKPPQQLNDEKLSEQVHVELNNTQPTRQKQETDQTTTKNLNDYLTELEQAVKQVEAPSIEWEGNSETESAGVDLVLHDTDVHFGSNVENKHGETVFNTEVAKKRYSEKINRFLSYAYEKDAEHRDGVDTVHWVLGGDIVEGTGIYDGQAHDVDMYINEQIETATEELTKAMKALIKVCDEKNADLQIICIPGNHGKVRQSSASNSANYDDLVYYNLQHATKLFTENAYNNTDVRFKRSDTVVEDTFPMRGGRWTGYITHGQHMKSHVGTSSGQKDALSITHQYDCDIIFRGHFHMSKIENVNGMPVIMSNSLKPGGPHEKTLQAYSDPGYEFYTVTDEEVLADVEFHTF